MPRLMIPLEHSAEFGGAVISKSSFAPNFNVIVAFQLASQLRAAKSIEQAVADVERSAMTAVREAVHRLPR